METTNIGRRVKNEFIYQYWYDNNNLANDHLASDIIYIYIYYTVFYSLFPFHHLIDFRPLAPV